MLNLTRKTKLIAVASLLPVVTFFFSTSDRFNTNPRPSETLENANLTPTSGQGPISGVKDNEIILSAISSDEETRFNVDVDRLLASDAVTYTDPYSGQELTFKRSKIIQNSRSQTLVGSVEIGGQARPMTATISPEQIFMSVPLVETTYSGSGTYDNVLLKRNKPVNDRIRRKPLPKEVSTTVAAREITDKCLNCD